jgi:hypothetical protein
MQLDPFAIGSFAKIVELCKLPQIQLSQTIELGTKLFDIRISAFVSLRRRRWCGLFLIEDEFDLLVTVY